jgi:hypothetical protein
MMVKMADLHEDIGGIVPVLLVVLSNLVFAQRVHLLHMASPFL